MARIIDFAAPVGQKAGTGHWNDLDMLEVGNGRMTFDEYGETRTSFSHLRHSPLLTSSYSFHNVGSLEKPPHPRKRRDQHGTYRDFTVFVAIAKSPLTDFATLITSPTRQSKSSPTTPSSPLTKTKAAVPQTVSGNGKCTPKMAKSPSGKAV
ncbi:MAG TPA: hypothetical protein VGO47_07500 [Chlamydiales bacterium]|jgi:hypothetical protein|nr:hypothetical protein [Chlamydiales bacterium]